MIGEPPEVASFREHFGWPDAVVQLPFGSEAVGEVIAQLERQPERVAHIRSTNLENALQRYDWAYRWRAVIERANLQELPRLERRLEVLKKLNTINEKSTHRQMLQST
jgi:hypothetical protein